MIINDQIMSMMIKTFGLSAKHVIGDSASHRVLHTLVFAIVEKILITIFLPNKQTSNIMEKYILTIDRPLTLQTGGVGQDQLEIIRI